MPRNGPMKPPPALTPDEIAERENISNRFVRKEIVNGNLPARYVGRKGYRVDVADYEAWRKSRRVVPRPDAVGTALAEIRGRR